MEQMPKSSRFIHKLLVPVVFVFSAVMFLIVFGQVIFRYVLNEPLAWSEELARYLMVWIACLASAEAYALGNHVGVKALVDIMPPFPRKWLRLFVHLAVIVLMGVIVYHGFRLSFLLRDQLSPALEIPMTWPYLAVPVGAVLILAQALSLFFHQITLPVESAPEA